MTKVTTKITNKKTSPINLALPNKASSGTKNRSIEPGKSVTLDFDIWSKLGNTNKLRLERLIRTNQISVETVILTEDNKMVTVGQSAISVEDAPQKEVVKAAPKAATKTNTQAKVDPTFRTTEDRNAIKGYKVVEGSDAIKKLGFSAMNKAKEFDHSKALQNNNDTKGFAAVTEASVNSLVNKNPSNVIKVDAPGLFKTANAPEEVSVANVENVVEESTVEESAVEDTVEVTAEEVIDTSVEVNTSNEPEAPTAIIDKMLEAGDLDQLKDYLLELYPELKITKKALKDCKSAQDIKLKFGLDDLL